MVNVSAYGLWALADCSHKPISVCCVTFAGKLQLHSSASTVISAVRQLPKLMTSCTHMAYANPIPDCFADSATSQLGTATGNPRPPGNYKPANALTPFSGASITPDGTWRVTVTGAGSVRRCVKGAVGANAQAAWQQAQAARLGPLLPGLEQSCLLAWRKPLPFNSTKNPIKNVQGIRLKTPNGSPSSHALPPVARPTTDNVTGANSE